MADRTDVTHTRAVAEIRRRVEGSTQSDVAKELGWDEGTLSRVLNAKRGVTLSLMQRARDAGIPMEWWAETMPGGEAA